MFWHDTDYHFFDYKYNIPGYSSQDYNGPARWVYLIFALVTVFAFVIAIAVIQACTKKKVFSQKGIDIYLKILGPLMAVLETVKITWESYYDIARGDGFNWLGLLPIYTCSLFIYTAILAGWTKGKVRRCCVDWMVTIGFVGGMSNVLFIQGLKWYPFWTFGAFYSMFFHYIMIFTSMLLVVSEYQVFEWKDIYRSLIPHAIFSCLVVPLDYIKHWDYMQYYDAGGVPLIENIVKKLAENGNRWLAVPLMFSLYAIFAAVFMALYILAQQGAIRGRGNDSLDPQEI